MKPGQDAFVAYSVGVCNASVCTNLPDDEAAYELNSAYPTGVGPWQLSDDLSFLDGTPMPCPCEHAPETHRHLLFQC